MIITSIIKPCYFLILEHVLWIFRGNANGISRRAYRFMFMFQQF